MKPVTALFLVFAFLAAWPGYAQEDHQRERGGGKQDDSSKSDQNGNTKPERNRPERAESQAQNNHQDSGSQTPRIDLSHRPFRNNVGNPEPNRTTRWSISKPAESQNANRPSNNQDSFGNRNISVTHHDNRSLDISRFVPVQPNAASNVAHFHHPYTQGYVRKKLQNLGVKAVPQYITDRRGILVADKRHSIIRYPDRGPGQERLSPTVIAPKNFNNRLVTSRMARLRDPRFSGQVTQWNYQETRPNHYYWHEGEDFNYCHYVDDWGYHWYGWYEGDHCFWTRYYGDRWWCYDADDDRWCFWNDGWWWQDPYHVGDLYFYNYGQYIPADSARDVVVTTVQAGNELIYQSPDGSRLVKVMPDSGDAFLFDTAIPPSFNPIYLASGATGVKFSYTNDGSPLQVMLTLNDGDMNVFDDQGNSLNFIDADNDEYDGPDN